MTEEVKVEPKVEEAKVEPKVEVPKVVKPKINLKNVAGENVLEKDYFYSPEGKGEALAGFHKAVGQPVDREDLLKIFNKIFKPEHNFLFYKCSDREMYIVIVPLKYAAAVGETNNSISGEFQKHVMSFLGEGSVNLTTMELKLKKIASTISIVE